jgi:hypothetical protein
MRSMRTRMLIAIMLAQLAACGGGGSEDGTGSGTNAGTGGIAGTGTGAGAATCAGAAVPGGDAKKIVSGVFGGTLKDGDNYDLLYVVMRDGTKVGYFGTDGSNTFNFVGSWTSYNPVWGWTSQDGTISRSFNGSYRGEPAYVATKFDMAIPCLSGLITAGQFTTRTATFDGGSIPNSTYVYNAPASVTQVTGAWELTDSAANRMTIDVAADGSLKGAYVGCSLTGSVKPSDGGENALKLSFDFDVPVKNCAPALENASGFNGFAIALPLSTGRTRLLFFAESFDAWNTFGFTAVGQR